MIKHRNGCITSLYTAFACKSSSPTFSRLAHRPDAHNAVWYSPSVSVVTLSVTNLNPTNLSVSPLSPCILLHALLCEVVFHVSLVRLDWLLQQWRKASWQHT
eukprot:GHRQ01030445.1.p1 GENE.GHRQ01030445.1~~GHRQ01030445.1.p1  ORF type:complete len:102 (-),score=0.60 GHRQ01030445.1:430-735(-)